MDRVTLDAGGKITWASNKRSASCATASADENMFDFKSGELYFEYTDIKNNVWEF